MSVFENLDELRQQNKNLLGRLREQSEKLECLTGSMWTQGRCPDTQVSPTSVVVNRGEQSEARASLSGAKKQGSVALRAAISTTKLRGTTEQREASVAAVDHSTPAQPVGLKDLKGVPHGRGSHPAQQTGVFADVPQVLNRNQTTVGEEMLRPRPHETSMAAEWLGVEPLLGYDWIAGLLDVGSSLTERSEQFFAELRHFRQVNREECVHTQPIRTSDDVLGVPFPREEPQSQLSPDIHTCTFCYRINSRLFATPVDSHVACQVCHKFKSEHPHSLAEPASIRVSVPSTTLLPVYRYKIHRRSSFDTTDCLGLPSHCFSGYPGTVVSPAETLSSLDLRSSLDKEQSVRNRSSQVDASVPRMNQSLTTDELLDVSRLARFRFQPLPHNLSKSTSSSFPVY